jgi:3alpha(or 20beta)-hydroxysteroid dehydrogenase
MVLAGTVLAGTVSVAAGLLAGRAAIVTGGSRGLGAAIAARFASAGARGAVIDISPPTALPPGWIAVQADAREEDSTRVAFDEATEALGPPRVVVANAGVVPPWTSTVDIDPRQWDEVFEVNIRGVMLTIREAVRRMTDGGSIVAMSSLNGWKGDPNVPAYVASKHAVVGLVRSAALDVGRRGIRVNALAPGPIATEALLGRMATRAQAGRLPAAEALRQAGEYTAMGRIATAEEVADAALFLASDLSAGITGHLLPVDAGML